MKHQREVASTDATYEVLFLAYERYAASNLIRLRFKAASDYEAILQCYMGCDSIEQYFSDYDDYDKFVAEYDTIELLSRALQEINGDGRDFIFSITETSTGRIIFNDAYEFVDMTGEP
jgi:5'-deoxynucleotidase YfbR-like HD superfamily hydrolase